MYVLLSLWMVLQYSAGDVLVRDTFNTPKPLTYFQQLEESGNAVPACDEKGMCYCPQGHELVKRQHHTDRMGEVLSCKPMAGVPQGKAKDEDYPVLPRPSTYGK